MFRGELDPQGTPQPPTAIIPITMKKLLLLAAAAVLGTSAANAAIYAETELFSFVPNGSQTLTFTKVTLGVGEVIDSIKIEWVLDKTGGSLGVDNESGTPASGQITQTVIIDLTASISMVNNLLSPIGQNVSAVSTSPTLNLDEDDGDGVGFQADGTDWAVVNFSPEQTTGSDFVGSAVFSQYEGPGTFTIDVDGFQTNNTTAFGGASGTFTPATASGSVTITYTTYIPEPSSAALVGLVGMGALLRRRRN